jgi:hypothetical protein
LASSGVFRIIARASVYLLLAACTQSAFEKYGCACDSRTYTVDEIAEYRAGAAKNDLEALAQMEEYHRWRTHGVSEGSPKYQEEEAKERSYYLRRLALNDPEVLRNEAAELSWTASASEMSTKDREQALLKAMDFALRDSGEMVLVDEFDPERKEVNAIRYLARELRLVHRLGENYYATRDRQMRKVAAEKGIKLFY